MDIMKNYVWILLVCLGGGLSAQPQTVGTFINTEESYNGYTLFAPGMSKTSYLINNCGEIINTWTSDYNPGLTCYLDSAGRLLRAGFDPGSFNGGGVGGVVEIFNWEGDLVWSYRIADQLQHQHHDIEWMPNGNILAIVWERITAQDAIAKGRNPSTIAGSGFWPDKIVEFKPIGSNEVEIVWEWHLLDHVIQDFDASQENFGVIADHPELLDINLGSDRDGDWVHFNGLDYNPDLDQIVLSSRHLDEIYVIDHSTTTQEAQGHEGGRYGKGGDLLYRYGFAMNYGRGNSSSQYLGGQHDVKWIPPGYVNAGGISIFNNGLHRNFSSGDVIFPPIEPDGTYRIEDGQSYEPFGPSIAFTDSPANNLQTFTQGGAFPLPNGSMILCEANSGRFIEIDTLGQIVWEYVNPVTNNGPIAQGNPVNRNGVMQAERYAVDFAGFEGKDLSPKGVIELQGTDNGCQIFDGINTSLSNIDAGNNFGIRTNPVSAVLSITNGQGETFYYKIFDVHGKLVDSGKSSDQIHEHEVRSLQNGMYILKLFDIDHFPLHGGIKFIKI